jgi:hypothetical protein
MRTTGVPYGVRSARKIRRGGGRGQADSGIRGRRGIGIARDSVDSTLELAQLDHSCGE